MRRIRCEIVLQFVACDCLAEQHITMRARKSGIVRECLPSPALGVLKATGYNSKTVKSMRYVILVLAVAGIVVSGLALQVHYSTESAPCRINDKWDCGVVNHSPYAEVQGVPVAAVGIAGYLLIAVLALLRRRGLLLVAVVVGLGFALYLTHIERDILGVWCLYCVISQGIIALLALLSIGWFVWAMRNQGTADRSTSELKA